MSVPEQPSKETVYSKPKARSFFLSLLPLYILAHFGHHLVTALPQPMMPFIRDEFKLDYTRVAFTNMAFSLSSGFAQLPAGWLADHIGRRILITVGILGVAIMGFGVGLSHTYLLLMVFLVLMGLCAGGYHPSASPLVASSVAPKIRGRALGFHLIGGSASFFLSPLIAAAIAGMWGWRASFITMAIPGAILGIAFFIILGRRTRSASSQGKGTAQVEEIPPPKSKRPLIAFMTLSVINGGIAFSAMSFLSVYMVDNFNIARETAASLLAINYSAGLWVGPVGGFLSDRVGRVPIILTCSYLSAVFIFLLTIAPYGIPFFALLFLMGINNYLRMPVSESFIIGQTSAKRRSTMFGIYNFAMQETGAVFSPFIGMYADKIGLNSIYTFVSAISISLTIALTFFLIKSEDR